MPDLNTSLSPKLTWYCKFLLTVKSSLTKRLISVALLAYPVIAGKEMQQFPVIGVGVGAGIFFKVQL